MSFAMLKKVTLRIENIFVYAAVKDSHAVFCMV